MGEIHLAKANADVLTTTVRSIVAWGVRPGAGAA